MASRVEIGKKISIERRALGYTQQKLSELIRINKTTRTYALTDSKKY